MVDTTICVDDKVQTAIEEMAADIMKKWCNTFLALWEGWGGGGGGGNLPVANGFVSQRKFDAARISYWIKRAVMSQAQRLIQHITAH